MSVVLRVVRVPKAFDYSAHRKVWRGRERWESDAGTGLRSPSLFVVFWLAQKYLSLSLFLVFF
jgi:hypothetical protein